MYAKLFTSIYQGTLRGNSHGLLVFTNLLAHADKDGCVDIHPKAIAEEVGLTTEQVKEALLMLESPDDESRSPEEQGRRIRRMDEHRAWGWRVVNYMKYRSIRNEDDRREQNRQSQERWRQKNKPQSADVSQGKPQSAHTEAEAKADTEGKNTKVARAVASACPVDVSPQVFEDWAQLRKAKKSPITKTALVGVRRQAEKAGLSMQQALEMCCERGWSGFKAEWVTERTPVGRQAGIESRNAAVVARLLNGGSNEQG